MKKFKKKIIHWAVVVSPVFLTLNAFATPSMPGAVILVDKNLNQLHLAHYVAGEFRIEKTLHATLGRLTGDKFVQDDLKTPEGIYFFTREELPPSLPKKYGSMAFDVDYPNPVDKFEHRTGYGIMLHSTDEPSRLQKNFDSRGCIVVDNNEIKFLSHEIRVGLTPILVFQKINQEFLHPGSDPELNDFFKKWVQAWQSRSIDSYIAFYHSEFSNQGRRKSEWKSFKESLNKRYKSIEVMPEEVRIFKHPKYTVITFVENYKSVLSSGALGHQSRGTKMLYVTREMGQPKILAEIFSPDIEPNLQAKVGASVPQTAVDSNFHTVPNSQNAQ